MPFVKRLSLLRLISDKAFTLLLTLSFLASLNGTAQAQSSSYSSPPAYSGGNTTVTTANGNYNTPYSIYAGAGNANNYGGAFGINASSVQCTGAIATTFTWSGTAPAPANSIVVETCSAYANASSNNYPSKQPSAACADGFGDTGVPTSTSQGSNTELVSATVQGARYTVASGTTITLSCSPSASASSPNSGNAAPNATAGVTYSATVNPVTISLGGAQKDTSGNYDILVGQQCTASISGIPSALLNNTQNPPVYSWTVSGDTFQSWNPTTPTTEVDGPGPLTNSTASWYWKDQMQTPETVKCSVTLTPPAGQGSAFTVTATQMATVYVPDWSQTFTLAGSIYVDANCPNYNSMSIYAGPTKGQKNQHGGMTWDLIVATPQMPIAFGSGTIELVQLIGTQRSYYTNSGTTKPVQGAQYVSIDNGKTGLDTEYPYANATGSGTTATLGQSDSPNIALDASIYSASLQDSFTDYLLYKPSGTGSVSWVPLASMTWHPSGSATIPASGSSRGDWTKYTGNPGTVTGGNFSATSTFPSWTASYSGNDGYKPAL